MSLGSCILAVIHHLLLTLTPWVTASYHFRSFCCIITSLKCLSVLKFNVGITTGILVNRVSRRLERNTAKYIERWSG